MEILKLAIKIGCKTFGDLLHFKQNQVQKGETLLEALTRYNNEVYGD